VGGVVVDAGLAVSSVVGVDPFGAGHLAFAGGPGAFFDGAVVGPQARVSLSTLVGACWAAQPSTWWTWHSSPGRCSPAACSRDPWRAAQCVVRGWRSALRAEVERFFGVVVEHREVGGPGWPAGSDRASVAATRHR